ncbi:hypothetical protein NDA07_01885 [Microcoleus vaginatus DQ-U2]|uniref:hypothetical protein n=1 Tax=Microcoleus vaginatus TaxID=119532 RepID=UPI00168284F8|nr:hypothetical protein [Microcoleus sp. FACHB-DQ6]
MPFQPPANLKDFDLSASYKNRLYEEWDKRISMSFNRVSDATKYPRFYSPLNVPSGVSPIQRSITWPGFPRVYDNWANIESNPTLENFAGVHRAAEVLRPFVSALFQVVNSSGKIIEYYFQYAPFMPASGLQMVPYNDSGVIDRSGGFALEERVQDEYLEWHVERIGSKVTKITYTAEGPEYWEVLANNDKTLALELYRKYISNEVRSRDIFWQTNVAGPIITIDRDSDNRRVTGYTPRAGWLKDEYNPHNIWNTRRGAMHLIQRNNSLSAEIQLAADATRRWAFRSSLTPPNPDGNDRFRLTGCGRFGGINRNSDPTIGYSVNEIMLNDLAVTISDPVGLYISEIQLDGLKDPKGNTLARKDVLNISRGDENLTNPRILRFTITPPAGADYGLEQCTLNGFPLSTGGPIARQTSITIYGEAIPSLVTGPIALCEGVACQNPNPDRSNYWEIPAPGKECKDIDWSKIEPPFGFDSLESNIVLDRGERTEMDLMARRMQ